MQHCHVWLGWGSLITAGAAALAGCIVIKPLEEYPDGSGATTDSAGSGGSRGGAGGAGGAGGKKPAGGSGGCTTNADCVEAGAGEPYLCRKSDQTCTRLKTEVCPLAEGDVAAPDAIVFGAFASLSPTVPERNPIVYAYNLALDELSGDNIGGLPDGPDGARRPLVMVTCYNQDDKVVDALEHLIGSLEVPAIVATLKPGDLRRAYETHSSRDVFYLSPVSVTEPVAQLDDQNLVWNLLGQPGDLAPTYAAVLRRTEKYLRVRRGLPTSTPLRVALLTSRDAFDSELANKVSPQLSFNGLSLEKNEANGDYTRLTVNSSDTDDVEQVATQLIDFRPDIVLSAGSEAITMPEGIIDRTEAFWETHDDGKPLPMYVLSPYNAGDLSHLTEQLSKLAELSDEDDPQRRFIGISIAGPEDTSAQFEYRTRLGARFGDIFNDTANYYDAVYLLAYAMYGAGNEAPLTGTRIAAGMNRLLSGNPMPVGPNDILATFAALSDGEASIEVQPTMGPPPFDATTGVRQVDGSVFCFTRNGKEILPRMDVLRYDRALESLREIDDFCFDGFQP